MLPLTFYCSFCFAYTAIKPSLRPSIQLFSFWCISEHIADVSTPPTPNVSLCKSNSTFAYMFLCKFYPWWKAQVFRVHSLSFDRCIHVYNPCKTLSRYGREPSPQKALNCFLSQFNLHSHRCHHYSDFFLSSTSFVCHGTSRSACSYGRHLSPSLLFSAINHVIPCIDSLFPFLLSIIPQYESVFSLHGCTRVWFSLLWLVPISSFYLFWVMLLWTFLHMCFYEHIPSCPLDKCPGPEWLGNVGVVINLPTFPEQLHHFPINDVQECRLVQVPSNIYYLWSFKNMGVLVIAPWITNPANIHESTGSIPGLAQGVKDLALPWAVV